jgi:hypothetical protein
MTKITDKEILDFVKQNIELSRNDMGLIRLSGLNCNIFGDHYGNHEGDHKGHHYGDHEGNHKNKINFTDKKAEDLEQWAIDFVIAKLKKEAK